ncbi:MAG: 5'/3'-nucleotidase SurE [Endomicrobiaceae bacterium]
MKKMNILISNDDGISGAGLKPLIDEMSKLGKVYVIVPEHEMSGTSQSITLNKYKQIKKYESNIYTLVGGTPTDCVKYGLYSFLKNKIDLVVSGINTCPNLGQDVVYSGTVACAREGAYLGIPSMAVSAVECKNPEYENAARIAVEIAKKIINKTPKKRPALCLNVNIPKDPKGIKMVPLGIRCYDENIVSKRTSDGVFYKLAGRFISGEKNKKSDIDAVEQSYVSVTPLQLDQTHFDYMTKYKFMEENFESE